MTDAQRITIYGLFDPVTAGLRYIGKTKHSVQSRMAQHRLEATKKRLRHIPKNRWFAKLRRGGAEPVIRALVIVPEYRQA